MLYRAKWIILMILVAAMNGAMIYSDYSREYAAAASLLGPDGHIEFHLPDR